MTHSLNWFEIPVKDLNRARAFYSKILNEDVHEVATPNLKYAYLPANVAQGGIGGALAEGGGYEPSATGTVVYLNGGEDLDIPLARVSEAGGQVILPKTSLGNMGFMALFIDSEGNKVGFHSMK